MCETLTWGFELTHTIDFCESEALGHASLVCMVDFSRLGTMYLPVNESTIIAAQVPSIHAFLYFFCLKLKV